MSRWVKLSNDPLQRLEMGVPEDVPAELACYGEFSVVRTPTEVFIFDCDGGLLKRRPRNVLRTLRTKLARACRNEVAEDGDRVHQALEHLIELYGEEVVLRNLGILFDSSEPREREWVR